MVRCNPAFEDFSFDNIDNLPIDNENYKSVLSVNEIFWVENSNFKRSRINLNILNRDNIIIL